MMIKYVIIGLSALVMLGGCAGQQAKPQPVKKVVQEKPKPKPVPKRHFKKGEVPPLPEREVDVDLDSMVDQAAAEVLNDDNAVQQ